ncbi:Glu/Leu/Phe/Val dehydrogenase dimerization domain-containing protein [Phycicoccus sp. M110.8]|uniref:Glu/Leu/Phe/Val dehydrogenase dimerization domain-containing protein n=1 Tax=Phycicoccus sp. M110.8 TaxID=3075433 RepID=UPI0028FD33F4|nr:Glu/Leu/Phe/Val dehydrogenase dimerization domain-containing protein [Phycicoccus sp. M110.8]MDU0313447.1 Glu/Leu/Phe/Val dehydrogenase dimerization domain-containing protein [Phycicoccus sp. M110.8]
MTVSSPPTTSMSQHEQVVFCHDKTTGLRAIIGIYSTALGPALGGTRFYPYATEEEALADVLRLSKGMAYKNAVAGLELGGGKAVIIGDPATDKTPDLLRAYGRFVESLGGRYVTACDVGTYVADMDVVSETTRFATGRSEANGGAGDSSVLTAYGVFQGQRACAQHVWGSPTLRGRTVGIAGVGKVGRILTGHLLEDGARVVVTDVNQEALEALTAAHPEVEVVADTDALIRSDIDVYAPCALGGALDDATVAALRATVVCGGANNQLVTEGEGGTADQLAARGITYAPDFLVNAGGVIQVSDELHGFDFERAKKAATAIFDHTLEVLETAQERSITPAAAADHIAEERMAAKQAGGIWLPAR